jgi:hypothetical protein
MRLFKRKEKTELDKDLAKFPRWSRKKALMLLKQYENGRYLRPGEDIDNKQLILDKS